MYEYRTRKACGTHVNYYSYAPTSMLLDSYKYDLIPYSTQGEARRYELIRARNPTSRTSASTTTTQSQTPPAIGKNPKKPPQKKPPQSSTTPHKCYAAVTGRSCSSSFAKLVPCVRDTWNSYCIKTPRIYTSATAAAGAQLPFTTHYHPSCPQKTAKQKVTCATRTTTPKKSHVLVLYSVPVADNSYRLSPFNPLLTPLDIQSLIAIFVTIGLTPLALGNTLASATYSPSTPHTFPLPSTTLVRSLAPIRQVPI